MNQEEFYKILDGIENLYNKYIISLEEYFELKNRLVTEYQGFPNKKIKKIKRIK